MQCKINTPFAKSLSDIKTEILEQTADKIHTRHTYSNGLVLEYLATADGVSISSNWGWKKEPDGSLTPVPVAKS